MITFWKSVHEQESSTGIKVAEYKTIAGPIDVFKSDVRGFGGNREVSRTDNDALDARLVSVRIQEFRHDGGVVF